MPDKFKDAFNVQMAIPAWALISFLISGIFSAGAIYTKLTTLADSYSKTADVVTNVRDKQIASDVRQTNFEIKQNVDSARITSLEQKVWVNTK